MENDAPLPPSAGRAGTTLLAVLAVLGLAGIAYVLRKPLFMAVPLCTSGRWDLCFGTFNGVGLVTLAALPLAALAVWLRARHHAAEEGTVPFRAGRGRRIPPSALRTALAEVGMVYGTLPWVWITMLPGSGAGVVAGRVSLVPLRDLATMDAGQVIGNLLVFSALGFLAPLRFRALASVPRMLALGAACSVLVEVAQYVLRLDRVSSVDDVLLNATGAGLAALASRPWWHARALATPEFPEPRPTPRAVRP